MLKLSTQGGFEPISLGVQVKTEDIRGAVCIEILEAIDVNVIDPAIVHRSCWRAEEQPNEIRRLYRGLEAGTYVVRVMHDGIRLAYSQPVIVLCSGAGEQGRYERNRQQIEDDPCVEPMITDP